MTILVLLAGLVLMRESRHEPLDAWDNAWADFLAMHSRHGQSLAPVTLVEIDDESLQNHVWPWTPLDFSLFFQAVFPHQPKALAVPEVLDWNRLALSVDQAQKLPQFENILRDSLRRAPNLLLGAELGFPDDPQVAPKWQEVPLLRHVKGDLANLVEFPIVEHQPAEDYRLTAQIGFTNLPAVHERFNSVPLLFRHRGQVVPSFVLQAAMLWAQLTPDAVKVELGSHLTLGEKLRIPIDSRGRMRVDLGTPKTTFSFDDLLLASEQIEAKNPPVVDLRKIKDTIVILARTDAEARTLPLAARRNGSPGELFAAAIATIQNQSFIRRAPLWTEVLVLLAISLVSFRLPRVTKGRALVLGFVTLAIYILLAMAVFNRWLMWLPGVLAFGMLGFAVIFRLAVRDAVGRPKKPVIL